MLGLAYLRSRVALLPQSQHATENYPGDGEDGYDAAPDIQLPPISASWLESLVSPVYIAISTTRGLRLVRESWRVLRRAAGPWRCFLFRTLRVRIVVVCMRLQSGIVLACVLPRFFLPRLHGFQCRVLYGLEAGFMMGRNLYHLRGIRVWPRVWSVRRHDDVCGNGRLLTSDCCEENNTIHISPCTGAQGEHTRVSF